MKTQTQAIVTVLGRILLSLVFLMSALGSKIPNFSQVAGYMTIEGDPASQAMLVGAIVFLVAGSLALIFGFKARIGATLLLIFLVLATYYFHDFWAFEDAAERQMQMIQFMKNMALMGAMLLVIANGAGPCSFDAKGTTDVPRR